MKSTLRFDHIECDDGSPCCAFRSLTVTIDGDPADVEMITGELRRFLEEQKEGPNKRWDEK